MYIKVKVNNEEDILVLAEFTGMAPCQILTMNKITSLDKIENYALGSDVTVKISLPSLVRNIGMRWIVRAGRIVKV